MIIKYGKTDITNLLLEYKRIGDIDNNNLTLLGNTPSYQIDIKIDNDQAAISSPDELITIYEDDVLKGTYFIYEAPEKYTKILSLTCFDFMLFLNTPYDSKITYPTTIKNQLDEISNITGLTIDYTNLDVLNQEVNWYDNTLACRDYVGWIAEVCGMNSYADERGIIKFKKITSVVDYETEDIGDYDIGDFYKVSRVCFDNGILKLETGSNLNNTLYLSSNNPYIDTTNNPVEKIYDMYKDLSIYSINDLQAAGLDYISLFDVLKFSDYKVLCLSVTSTFKGGSYQIQDIDGVLPSSNADKVTIKYDATTRMKKIEVLIDQNSQTLEIVAKEQEGLNEKYSDLKIDVDGISLKTEEALGTMYKMETGRGNIFDNCQQQISKDINDSTTKSLSTMPLGVNKDDIVGKDICIAVDVWAKNAIPRSLAGYMGAYFTVTYEDGTVKKYSTVFVPGIRHFQYTLATHTASLYQRIFTHYKIEDKPIKSVSNLTIEIACNGELLKASNPKVEYGTYPTGFFFDQKALRDNITNINRQYASIEINLAELKLQSVSMTEEITTINGNVSTLTTRLNSTELKLTPTAITAAVNEKIGADGQLRTTKFALDINGGHFYGGGLDISNNAGEKVLHADANGNLTIKNLNAINGNFSGTIISSTINGGTIIGANITGGTIRVTSDLYIGDNLFLGEQSASSIGYYKRFMFSATNGILSSKPSLGYDQIVVQSRDIATLMAGDGQVGSTYNASFSCVFGAANLQGAEINLSSNYKTTSNRAITISSDSRLKMNILDIDISTLIDDVNIKSFEYIYGGEVQVGVIAQELLNSRYRDYLVSQNRDGYYAVNYNVINMALVQKVQHMDKSMKAIISKLAELEGRALYAQNQ